MYHIKRDKRSERSAQLICAGLQQCLLKKEFKRLTIADILTASTVGRATFYRLFDSINDVLVYECDQLFQHNVYPIDTNETVERILLRQIKLFMDHDVLLETLIESQQIETIYNSQREQIKRVSALFGGIDHYPLAQSDFFLSHLTYLIVSTLVTWVKHDKRETAEELLKNLKTFVDLLSQSVPLSSSLGDETN